MTSPAAVYEEVDRLNMRAYQRMPIGYGAFPGPRQSALGQALSGWQSVKAMTMTVVFTCPLEQLKSFLPHSCFQIDSPLSRADLGYASISFTRLTNLPWLAGHGYNHVGLYVHDVVCQGAREVVRGKYLSVLFEDRAEPITSGREELGFAKVFASIEETNAAPNFALEIGWEGAVFGRITLDQIVPWKDPLVGMCLTTTPLYQSEMSPPYARGLLVGSHGAFLAIGYNIASWVGLGSFYSTNLAFAWRFPLALQVLFPLLLLIGSFWLPPSPRWLLANGRHDDGLRVLERLHASKDDPDHLFARAECAQIESQLRLERQKHNIRRGVSADLPLSKSFGSDFVDLFLHAPYRRRAILGFTIMFGAQCTGVLVINNYQTILFPALGVGVGLSLGLYSVYLAIALVGNSICGTIVDRFGRKKPLLIGLTGCTFALSGECILAHYAAVPGASTTVLALAVVFIFLYIPFFSSMIDPNMYIYASEIYPSEIRAIGVAISMSGQWLATILFLQSAPIAFAEIGYRFYIVFIVCTICLGLIILYFFPETKGLSLEEMAGVFGDEVALKMEDALRNDAKTATSVEQHESALIHHHVKSTSTRVEATTDHIPREL